MAKEWFEPHFHPARYSLWTRFTTGLQYYSADAVLQCVSLAATGDGRAANAALYGIADRPRLVRSDFPRGRPHACRRASSVPAGNGDAGVADRVPVVPVRIEGLERVFHRDAHWPSHGKVKVTFGAPLTLRGRRLRGIGENIGRGGARAGQQLNIMPRLVQLSVLDQCPIPEGSSAGDAFATRSIWRAWPTASATSAIGWPSITARRASRAPVRK